MMSWGTWEELLLACAVKRHGLKDWEAVAMEVQAKTALPQLLTTAYNCKLKYHDLQRRFSNSQHHQDEDDDLIPWLDDLKKLRLAQLRHDLHRYDVSILSLQSKVKRLEEERQDGGVNKDDEPKPDLEEEEDSKGRIRSENDKTLQDQGEPGRSKPLDHENQSVNGSNSTCSKSLEDHNKSDRVPTEPNQLPTGSAEPSKAHSDSNKGSCETVPKKRRQGDAAAETRESSEAQSSASLTRRTERKRRRTVELQDQPNEQVLGKSQPLVAILQMIRAQEHSSLFERRLTSQESDKYKSVVQQHVDLETIQTKLHKDSYSCSTLTFYRDLLLLFSNAAVFFPKSSTESVTAHQLRRLVLKEMKKNNLTTRPDPSSETSNSLPSPSRLAPKRASTDHELERSDSLLAKHKSTAPIIVCRKRSSISSKPSSFARKATDQPAEAAAFDLKPPDNNKPSNSKHVEEEPGSVIKSASKTKQKSVTGTRSSRRMTTSHHDNDASASSTKKKISSPAETPKAGRKRKSPEVAAASDRKRSGAAADFLKRIKRNSPAQKLKLKSGTGTSTSNRGAEQKKRGGSKADKVTKERMSRQSGGDNKKQVKEEISPSKRSVGRPSKKAAEAAAAATVVSPKRSRENGVKQQQQEASRRPKKRPRR